MDNYPAGVKASDFDDKSKAIELEVHLDDLLYDNGYGDQQAELSVTVTVKGQEVTIHEDGYIWLIDQDGGNMAEFPYETSQYDEIIRSEALRLADKQIIEP